MYQRLRSFVLYIEEQGRRTTVDKAGNDRIHGQGGLSLPAILPVQRVEIPDLLQIAGSSDHRLRTQQPCDSPGQLIGAAGMPGYYALYKLTMVVQVDDS